jgi:hypothetical protein
MSTTQKSNSNSPVVGYEITPLPIGSGGDNAIKSQLNNLNAQLTMMTAQAVENAKYDPPPPSPMTKPMVVEKFTNHGVPSSLAVIGILFFVYGMLRK